MGGDGCGSVVVLSIKHSPVTVCEKVWHSTVPVGGEVMGTSLWWEWPRQGGPMVWDSVVLLGCGMISEAGWTDYSVHGFPSWRDSLQGCRLPWTLGPLGPTRCQSSLLLIPEAHFSRACPLYGSLLRFD